MLMSSIGLKRVLAGVGSTMILLGSVLSIPLASAADFTDVPSTHTFYSFVQDGVSKGFFDAASAANANRFRPDDNMNRAELAKLTFLVAKHAGIVTALDTANAPQFTDVPATAWFAPYVLTTAKKGLLSGYKDAAGNPTGKYGPSDLVTRAQAAKAFINAAGVPNKTTPSATSIFSDVIAGQWYVDYVSTAYNKSVIDGYSGTNRFGPNDPVTRGQASKLISNSLNPKDRNTGTNGNTNGTTNVNTNGTTNGNTNGSTTNTNTNSTQVKAGNLDVALSPNTPAATLIPNNAQFAPFTTLRVTAGAGNDILLNAITMSRTGLGSRDDLRRCWFNDPVGNRLSNRTSVDTDDRVFTSFTTPYLVKSGTSTDLIFGCQMAGTSNVFNAFSLQKADDVQSSAAQITGSFPITGNTMQTANYSVTQLAYTKLGSDTKYKVGDLGVEVAKWKLQNTSSTKDVTFKRIVLKNNGSGKPQTDFANWKLYEAGNVVSSQISVSDDYVTIDLTSDINNGVTKTYSLRTDVIAADSIVEQIQFQVKYLEDLVAYEKTTGFAATEDPANPWTGVLLSMYTIEGGKITLTRLPESAPSSAYAKDADDVKLLIGQLNVGQGFTADGVVVHLCSNAPDANSYVQDLDNFRFFLGDRSLDTKAFSNTIDLTTSTFVGCPAGLGTVFDVVFDSTFTLNSTSKFTVMTNLEASATNGRKYSAIIANDFLKNQNPEYVSTGNTVQITDIIGQASGNVATVQNSIVTVSRTDGFTTGNEDIVPGANNVTLGKWSVTANDASDLIINDIQVRQLCDGNPAPGCSPNETGGAVKLPETFITSCNLFVNGTQVGTSENVSGGVALFDSVNKPLAKNSTAALELKCSISTGAPAGNRVGFKLDDLDIQDPNSNQATFTPTLPLASFAAFIVQGTGQLQVTRDAGTPVKGFIVADTQGVPVGRFKFSATNDDVTIRDFYLATVDNLNNPVSSTDGRVQSMELSWTGGTSTASPNNGLTHFTVGSGAFKVLQDGNLVGTVKANLNPINQAADTGRVLKLATVADVNPGECVYTSGNGVVDAGDVRATKCAGFIAGSTVTANDADAGMALTTASNLLISGGNATWVSGEFIYLSGDGLVNAGDTRVNNFSNGLVAGSTVLGSDADVGTTLTAATNLLISGGNASWNLVGSFNPGDSTLFVTGTVQGVRSISEGTGVELSAADATVSGTVNSFGIVKSKPTFANVALSTANLVPGAQQEIYRFTVAADAKGDIDLGDLSFEISTNKVLLNNIKIYDLDDIANPLNDADTLTNIGDTTTSESNTITAHFDNDGGVLGEEIAAGTTKTYVVKADIDIGAQFGTHTTSVRLAAENVAFNGAGTYAAQNALPHLILFSDEAESAHGRLNPASPDWMFGTFFNELPPVFTNLSLNN